MDGAGVFNWLYDPDTEEWEPEKLRTFYTITSEKGTHFTGALAQNAKEDENLTGLLGNKTRISKVAIQSKQKLDFWLLFWNTDDFGNTDLDVDDFCGIIHLDLVTFGRRVGGANQYYLSSEDLDLDCEDEDESKEIHVSLLNASATAKIAGTDGQVTVQVTYELME